MNAFVDVRCLFYHEVTASGAELAMHGVRFVIILLLFLAPARAAHAACECRCVDGQMQAVCASAIDLPRVCSVALCPIVPPAISPLERPQLPPLGTSSCRQEQVLDPATRRYEWRALCR
jgi:hypothetical protein